MTMVHETVETIGTIFGCTVAGLGGLGLSYGGPEFQGFYVMFVFCGVFMVALSAISALICFKVGR